MTAYAHMVHTICMCHLRAGRLSVTVGAPPPLRGRTTEGNVTCSSSPIHHVSPC